MIKGLAKFSSVSRELSPTASHLLFIISKEDNLKMHEICKKLNIIKSNLTPLVNNLLSLGLVERVTDLNDRRAINIRLTKKGEQKVRNMKAKIRKLLLDKLSFLSEKEIILLSESLKTVKKILLKAIDNKS